MKTQKKFRLGYWALTFLLGISACNNNNVAEVPELGKIIEAQGFKGNFGLFDNGQGDFQVYRLTAFRDSTYLPASTFKIVNALIGVETGRLNDKNTVIPWDGVTRPVDNWNQDLTLEKAFEYSAVPWFQELARRIGKDTMQAYIDSLGYGSRYGQSKIQNNLDSFWLDNSIRVTGDEQLGLVKRLYFDQLPFQQRTQRIVRGLMLRESNSNYQLAYKSGWGKSPTGTSIAWMVGWVEENQHPYFFSLCLEDTRGTDDLPARREAVLKNILRELGFLEGRK